MACDSERARRTGRDHEQPRAHGPTRSGLDYPTSSPQTRTPTCWRLKNSRQRNTATSRPLRPARCVLRWFREYFHPACATGGFPDSFMRSRCASFGVNSVERSQPYLLDDAVIPLPKPAGGGGVSDGEEFRTSAILNDDSPPGARWSRSHSNRHCSEVRNCPE